MSAKRKPEPYRRRLTIPQADESSATWYEMQDDPSASVRLLIRESIQRDGYVDVINRPVDRQPRRGRPPADEQRPSGSDGPDEDSGSAQEEPAQSTSTKTAPASSAEKAETEPAAADTGETDAETTKKDPAAEPELDDIFGSMRD